HIECSAMSLKYLGEQLDIHGGGQDLIFPHHENEIAQSESFTGKKPFVRYWIHNGALQMGGEKMSKSLGNLITIRDALKKYSADAIRLFVLGSHYRSPLTYSEEALKAAESGAERLRRTAPRNEAGRKTGKPLDPAPYRQRFVEAMDDDFNTPQALACLFDLARDINRADEAGEDATGARRLLQELGGGVLGLTFREPEVALDAEPFQMLAASIIQTLAQLGIRKEIPASESAAAVIDWLVSLRGELRGAKQFAPADAIRNGLARLGIVLEDTPQGTIWRIRR
ncbi:MAG: class I tRNA ligase family protein, partial [Dehalococcoidales bacterium]|nr:class I tRNA ligase family protein [Dehalococcoidales bacterium]